MKGTRNKWLKLGVKGDYTNKNLIRFADANWAEDKVDRKSNSGYILKLFGGSISWDCRKQTCVALSSTEAEYIALAEACQEKVWIHRLLQDMQFKKDQATVVLDDNQRCLKLIYKKKFSHLKLSILIPNTIMQKI